jgi:hypothetical protein
VNAGAAERIDSQANIRAANGIHVDHIAQIIDIGVEIVVTMCRLRAKSAFERNPFHSS